MTTGDEVLNAGFLLVHTLWIAFNCVGWLWHGTRRWHLVTVLLTGLSWFGLGAWYGWGYCPCTDWHWQVRARLGYRDPRSYTQMLAVELTGLDPGAMLANALTGGIFAVVTVLSVVLNVRDFRRERAMS